MEANPELRTKLARPQKAIVVTDPSEEFNSEDAANAVSQLLGFLWEYPEVFDAFTGKFLVPYCKENLAAGNPFKVDSILGLVIHRLFCEVTADVMDWRVVIIQERFIKQVIDEANSVEEIKNSPLLLRFFIQLTKTNEARRCLHYLFRVKCERIDTSFFTVKNLQKIY